MHKTPQEWLENGILVNRNHPDGCSIGNWKAHILPHNSVKKIVYIFYLYTITLNRITTKCLKMPHNVINHFWNDNMGCFVADQKNKNIKVKMG